MYYSEEFAKKGYTLFRKFFSKDELAVVSKIVCDADQNWREEYDFPENVNSAYLTSDRFLPDAVDRERLFEFISDLRLVSIAETLTKSKVFFLNTQLFFNPQSTLKKPYWHRDVQYLGVEEEKQKNIIKKDAVLHFRIPLRDDPGLEFIPGSHLRWDTESERNTRLELNGRRNFEELPNSIRVPHKPGDLLVFSAHLIHKGVYGLDRSSFDILYTSFPSSSMEVNRMGHFPNSSSAFFGNPIFETIVSSMNSEPTSVD
ncbi:phytanoyl-CoA dioxygenase family protein [Leptospira stimsonii]|uniref:Deoxygenase n=1 Tax=Leptospira stimsonii TaxID=2202203 RepID=A0ABY2ND48_9LEPT|nr:phytanoyl-CoA dioxygenase family protein [Leptospira stimsonii]TGK18455.1 deoxygenase [Leptospira stimsonii]TGM21905.1 deoxygenase [Leptospira stimsonii]